MEPRLRHVAIFCFLASFIQGSSALQRRFGGESEVHDEEHLKQHLVDKIDVDKMTPEQQQFYYFSMHDLNKDQRIDGIEILKAFAHDHEEGASGPGVHVNNEEEMIKMIDTVLNDSDFNGDGYIDYAEYLKKQGK